MQRSILSATKSKRHFSLIERLEDRRLMSVTLGTNLILNPGAESNTGATNATTVVSPTGWTSNGTPTVVQYGATGGFPSLTDPGPSGTTRGKNFFAGGPDGESDLFQTINLSSLATSIDAGTINYNLSAYLGGQLANTDNATVFLNFSNASMAFVGQADIGPVTPANRGDKTGLLLESKTAVLPKTTRFVQVQIHFESTANYDDGFADNTSLILTSNAPTTGTISGTVLNDLNGDGAKSTGETGLAGVKVFIDKNNNGKLDSGEVSTTTASNGTYSFTKLAAGAYKINEVVPSTYRISDGVTTSLSATVTSGGTTTVNFYDTQTALITGVVFNDANGNKIQDSTEAGLSGVTVYLDFNNNGQLDSFELKTTTDSSGKFKFIVPFGTYVIREVVPSGKIQTTPTSGFSVTLSKGQVSSTEKFGDRVTPA